MKRILLLIVFALVFPRLSAAQDTPRLGIVMGFPARVGVLWIVSDRLAIRPEFEWSRSSFETTTSVMIFSSLSPTISQVTTTSTSTSSTIGPAISALVYLSKGEALRTYVSPRFAYTRGTTTTELAGPLPTALPTIARDTTASTDTYGGSGSIGAQYTPAKRFAVFGEIGVDYSRRTNTPDSSVSRIETKSSSIGLRSGVGVVLFFGS